MEELHHIISYIFQANIYLIDNDKYIDGTVEYKLIAYINIIKKKYRYYPYIPTCQTEHDLATLNDTKKATPIT